MQVFTLQFTAAEIVLLQAAILELPPQTRAHLQKRIAEQTAPKPAAAPVPKSGKQRKA